MRKFIEFSTVDRLLPDIIVSISLNNINDQIGKYGHVLDNRHVSQMSNFAYEVFDRWHMLNHFIPSIRERF